jgi:hypothetical protein
MENFYPKKLIPIVISFVILLSHGELFAQVSTIGKEFWVGFMENNGFPQDPDIGIVVITASEASNGVIEYAGNTIAFNIQAGQQFVHRIQNFDILHRTSGVIENKGVYILSSGNIAVYAFNERTRSADGTVVLPTSTLGKEYYVTSHFELVTANVTYQPNVNNESTLLVVGVADNTEIEITPKVATVSGQGAGTPFTIKLNEGQSYQLKARGDLTGSRVRVIGADAQDCKNIAVFGGNKWTAVGNCGMANDHLYQQAYPVNTWGNDFLHVPLAGRTSGELVKILASEPGSEIFINGTRVGTIGAGEFLTRNFTSTEAVSITSDKPISVTGFAKSMDCNLPGFGSNVGDPFMVTYSPNQQLLRQITFNALQLPSIDFHYVNIITATSSVQKTSLDGQNVGNQFVAFPSNPDFSYARIQLSAGVHRLENVDGFIGYVYGFGRIESYGFAVGASLENLNFEVISNYEFDVKGEAVACLNERAEWEIIPENKIFQYFTWDFGDGSAMLEGKSVNHVYREPGIYKVIVTASISEDSCDQQEDVRFDVTVESYIGQIIGANSVCPDIDEIDYRFEINQEISKVEWEVEGGEIIEQTEEGVTIKWGPTNPTAKVIAQPFNLQGCPGETIEMIVKINNQIEPKLGLGEEKICYDGSTIHEYRTAELTNGRGYEWFVEGGDIMGSNENTTVQVNWSIPGITGKVWYREYSTINDDCEGVSPQLDVEISTLFTAEINGTTGILCFGEDTGRIEIKVSGGLPPYTFDWSHDPSLNTPIAESIPAGIYSVRITDNFGCEVILKNIAITEPPLLQIDYINTSATTCFGKHDGGAVIKVNGGTAPYTINLPTNSINGNIINVFDLEGRPYKLEIKDANGCILPVNFIIVSPLPLEVNVRIHKLACPGEANGELVAENQGGNAPFKYYWELSNSTQSLLQGVPRGKHKVTVEDSRGCVSFGTGEMLEADPIVRMPTGFNPKEGIFEAVSNCALTFELVIFNRWGELIYFGNVGWDGKVNNELAPNGSYTYVFSYNFVLNGEPERRQIKGSFILIR